MSTSISILGNTGRDVSLRYSEKGTAVASFPIASNSFKNSSEGKVKTTHWYNVTAFGKVAENLASTVRKGSHLLVFGRLSFKPWLTKDGEPRAGAEIVLQSYEFASSNQNSEGGENEETPEPEILSEAEGPEKFSAEPVTVEPFVDQF